MRHRRRTFGGCSNTCSYCVCAAAKDKEKMLDKTMVEKKAAEWRIPLPHAGAAVRRPGSYKTFLRVQEPQFDEILAKVTPAIEKQDTCLRECITPAERLAITLRYLASGVYPAFCFVVHSKFSIRITSLYLLIKYIK